jgi:hypothetical protein
VYGLPKATIYAGSPVNFSTFNVPSLTAPVTNAGRPMISSPVSFFPRRGTRHRLPTLGAHLSRGLFLRRQIRRDFRGRGGEAPAYDELAAWRYQLEARS